VAGVAEGFLDSSLADSMGAVRLNVATLVEATHGFGRRLRTRGRGGIVIMASLVSLGGRPLFAMYAGTKAFDAVFAESLWAELRDENIDVIGAIAPGMDTPTARRNRGSDEAQPWHQSATDVVAKTFDMLGHEALVYFPMPHEVDRFAAIRDDRRSQLLAAAEWVVQYKKETMGVAKAR
jgi:short-subunit dehydrogenase